MMNALLLLAFVVCIASGQDCSQWSTINNARVKPGFCVNRWATGLLRPRGIFIDSTGLVLIGENGRVSAFWDDNNDGTSSNNERAVLVTQSGLNHEVSVYDGFLYASSPTTVYRWRYTEGSRNVSGASEVVVRGIPSGGHDDRTLAFKDGLIYVHIGSQGNVDEDSSRSRVVRFTLQPIPSGGHLFDPDDDGQIFADGLRNENGINFDRNGLLWGVQNGRDNLQRSDMGNLVTDNPCEEINSYNESDAGAFYGYPYCWSDTGADPRTGMPARTQWADTQYFGAPYTDNWCRTVSNNIPPRYCIGAHQAPLGFTFYNHFELTSPGEYTWPEEYDGDMLVALHGSWNRSPAAGYQLRRVDFDASGNPVADEYIVEYNGANPPNGGGGWIRPVDADVQKTSGILFFTADTTNEIIAVRYMGTQKNNVLI